MTNRPINIVSMRDRKPHCQTCSLNSLCLPLALSIDEMSQLDEMIKRGKPLPKGKTLFQQGEPFNSIFAVRTGAIKTYTVTSKGEEQIIGFHLASEVIGLASYENDIYPMTACALESTTVCEVPLASLDNLADELFELRKHLMRMMSSEIRHDQNMMVLLGKKNSDERVASFLVDISLRQANRGLSPTRFRLPMSRIDISNYLGLAVETVSRVFTRFQKNQLIHTENKEIQLLDLNQLSELAGICTTSSEHKEGHVH